MDFSAFLETLPIMGKGMLGIFAVTLVITASMKILTAVFDNKE